VRDRTLFGGFCEPVHRRGPIWGNTHAKPIGPSTGGGPLVQSGRLGSANRAGLFLFHRLPAVLRCPDWSSQGEIETMIYRSLAILVVLLSISAAKAGPNEDAVAARAQWEQVYNSGDAEKFAAIYTKDAMLFGSTAQLFTGTDGVRSYFSKLPPGIKVKMGDQQAIAAGPDALLSSGFADFTLPNGTVLPFRLTLAWVKVDGKWLVAQHHGSPVPK
jgi:uncharacterized protein (TIGR02246 family)